MIPTPASPTDDTPDYVAVWFSLFCATIYIVGWSYLYGYYTAFGLSVRAVGLSAYDILLESIRMLQVNRWWAVGLMVISLVLVAGVRMFATKSNPVTNLMRQFQGRRWWGKSGMTLGILLALLLLMPTVFAFCAGAGRADAQEHMQESSSALPVVALEFQAEKVPTGLFDPDEITGGRVVDAGYRLLASTEKSFFLVRPIGKAVAAAAVASPRQVLVLEVPRDTVQGIRYLASQR